MHDSTDRTKHIESVVFFTLITAFFFASHSGVSSHDEPWSGRHWEMTPMNLMVRSKTNPLPRALVSDNGLKADVLRVVDIVDGSGEVSGDTLLLTIFSMPDEYGVGAKVHTHGPVLASIVVDDVADDTSVVAKEGIE